MQQTDKFLFNVMDCWWHYTLIFVTNATFRLLNILRFALLDLAVQVVLQQKIELLNSSISVSIAQYLYENVLLSNEPQHTVRYRQDCAPSQNIASVWSYLDDVFLGRWIGRWKTTEWSPKYLNLLLLGFLLGAFYTEKRSKTAKTSLY